MNEQRVIMRAVISNLPVRSIPNNLILSDLISVAQQHPLWCVAATFRLLHYLSLSHTIVPTVSRLSFRLSALSFRLNEHFPTERQCSLVHRQEEGVGYQWLPFHSVKRRPSTCDQE
jgi:hypothetical protein